MITNEPLVTIAVIAYRASDFILETLESIKKQTYKNIELVVSDDASPDDTVEKCKIWISSNKNRFVAVKLLTVEKNTGVSGNCKRAFNAASGSYFKVIGSDDILLSDCIEKFVEFFTNNNSVKFAFAKEIRFTGAFSEHKFHYCSFPHRALCFRESVTAKDQLRTLSKQFIGVAPTMFAETDTLRQVGGVDDRYATDDGPLYIRVTSAGIKMHFMDEFVVYRRIHEQSLTHKKSDTAVLKGLYTPNKKRWTELQYAFASPFWKKCHKYSNWLCDKIISSGNDKRILKCRFYDFLRRWVNPFKWNLICMNTQEWVLNRLGY